MTNREELLQELELAPDDIVESVLDFFRRVKATSKSHPLAKFAGILSNVEAEELKRATGVRIKYPLKVRSAIAFVAAISPLFLV